MSWEENDITMCDGDGCKKRKTCNRYQGNHKVEKYQSFFLKSPRRGNKCKMYWKLEPNVPMKQCLKCGAIMPTRMKVCPVCELKFIMKRKRS